MSKDEDELKTACQHLNCNSIADGIIVTAGSVLREVMKAAQSMDIRIIDYSDIDNERVEYTSAYQILANHSDMYDVVYDVFLSR